MQSKDAHDCATRFVPGQKHFKSKFCPECRKRIFVSEERVRALTVAHEEIFYNTRGAGFWSAAPSALRVGSYRIINNAVGCKGPSLILFEDHPPELAWHPMPIDWRLPSGLVEFRIARGTLVPLASLRVPPMLCRLLVPSVAPMRLKSEPNNQENQVGHPFLAALNIFDTDDDNKRRFNGDENGDDENGDDENGDDENGDDGDDYACKPDAAERKKALRMKRNRESAATSRDRKRRYIFDLEQQVYALTATVKTLREENSLLSLLNLQPADDRFCDAMFL